jgi:cell wall-associated NlpC family hydrolase
MNYAIVKVPAAPVRRKAMHQVEMVSQLLFGETVRIIRTKGNFWIKISSLHDNYEGWITSNLIEPIDEATALQPAEYIATDLLNTVLVGDKAMHIPLGSTLPLLNNGNGKAGAMEYSFSGKCSKIQEQKPSGELLNNLVMPWLNTPYMWGGRTILGVDCSGFVQVNYKMMGIDLPRDAWQQAQKGWAVKKIKDAKAGDLAFFDDKDEIVHVGILLNNQQIIHASGKVRIDSIDKKGIINSETGKRSHRLEIIRRLWD